ncbi:Bro-N domain-containing protein [Moraxella equi]|uniref:Uncharacterized phage-encoded protein n=1 Tax=Moraxella equi TaxID=60442 RepID=A0A378QMB4_9GAMM|nr:Bro-N domain-containing protein [Moraxella equi]OPH36258.1 hypothetical protein B5J93_09375 [Moraxella equi]STZ01985.1 Uncharacterized phage-encoded protein [Moraxella equi]
MSNLINFTFEQSPIRIIDQQGEFWFVANDVCNVLEIANARDALSRLDDDEKADVALTDTSSNGVKQSRKLNIINESGLYALILRSRKAMQKGTVQHKFRKWVTSEVLPSIRKTGQYRHTISAQQQAQTQQAIKTKCQHNKVHYQTLYHALYQAFSIPRYSELLACDFERALAFIWGFEFTPSLNTAFIANILADNAHQIKQAQDEFWGVMGDFRNILEHLDKLQRRLEKSERCIQALQKQF